MGGRRARALRGVITDQRLYLLAVTTVLLAVATAVRRRGMRPILWLLLGGLAIDLSRRGIRVRVLEPAAKLAGGAPLEGSARAAGHLSQGLFMGWGAGILAVILRVFGRVPWWLAGAWWLSAWAYAVVSYPALREAALGRFYLWWTISVVVLSGLCVARFFWMRGHPRQEHVATLWVLAVESSLMFGPYLDSDVFETWWTAKIAYAAMYSVLILVLAGGLLWTPKLSSN